MSRRSRLPRLTFILALIQIVMLGQSSLGVKLDSTGTVTEVLPGGAGAKAGFKTGDTIVALNNHQLTSGLAEIESTLGKTRPGSLLPIGIRRAGHTVTLFAFPARSKNSCGVLVELQQPT